MKSHFCQSKHIGGAICEAAIAADQGAWHDIEGPTAARCERPQRTAPEGCKLKRPPGSADRGRAGPVGGGKLAAADAARLASCDGCGAGSTCSYPATGTVAKTLPACRRDVLIAASGRGRAVSNAKSQCQRAAVDATTTRRTSTMTAMP
jgi:hypothetical protein